MMITSLGEVLLSDFLCVLQVTQQQNGTGNKSFLQEGYSVTYDTIMRLSSYSVLF